MQEYKKAKHQEEAPKLSELVEEMAKGVSKANRMAFPVINTLKRALTEVKKFEDKQNEGETVDVDKDLRNLVENDDDDMEGEFEETDDLFGALKSIVEDFQNINPQICDYLLTHVDDSDEIILTFGYSEILLYCFDTAKKTGKDFKVMVVNCLEKDDSLKMVDELREKGIEAYEIKLTSIFTIMSKITKVIVGCFAVMADGGIIDNSGIFSIGMIAKQFSIPFLVVSSFYELTPNFCFNQDTYNELINPTKIFNPNGQISSGDFDVIIPKFDFLSPEYITLHITQFGEQTNFYVYRLFNEIYTKEVRNADY